MTVLGCVVMKNWLPLVLGPQLAMETLPGAECLREKWRSAGMCAEGGRRHVRRGQRADQPRKTNEQSPGASE